jgi:hypothetical protein
LESENLKDLIKTLLSISQKENSRKYIAKNLNLDVQEEINRIRGQLEEVKEKIEDTFKNSREDSDRAQLLLSLLKTCKFYNSIE